MTHKNSQVTRCVLELDHQISPSSKFNAGCRKECAGFSSLCSHLRLFLGNAWWSRRGGGAPSLVKSYLVVVQVHSRRMVHGVKMQQHMPALPGVRQREVPLVQHLDVVRVVRDNACNGSESSAGRNKFDRNVVIFFAGLTYGHSFTSEVCLGSIIVYCKIDWFCLDFTDCSATKQPKGGETGGMAFATSRWLT